LAGLGQVVRSVEETRHRLDQGMPRKAQLMSSFETKLRETEA